MKCPFSVRRAGAIAGLAILAGLTAWLAVWGAESPEAREIKERLRGQARRIESIEVSYNLEATSPLKPEQLVALAEFHNKMWLQKEQWHEAFKGEKRYRRMILPERIDHLRPPDEFGLTPPGPVNPKAPAPIQENQKKIIEQYERASAAMKAQDAALGVRRGRKDPNVRDPIERDTIRAFNGRSVWMRRTESEKVDEYQVWPTKPSLNWFQASPYSQATGLHVPDPLDKSTATKVQAMFRVPDWVNDRDYQLEEKTEVIDGSTCVVLKGSLNSLLQPPLFAGSLTDRIWLDRDHGLAVRRREFAKDGRVGMRWINTDLREIAPGLWLPLHCRQEHYADDAPAEWKDKPVEIVEIRVTELDLNKVLDDIFDMIPRKSDRIEDLRGILTR